MHKEGTLALVGVSSGAFSAGRTQTEDCVVNLGPLQRNHRTTRQQHIRWHSGCDESGIPELERRNLKSELYPLGLGSQYGTLKIIEHLYNSSWAYA